MAAGSAGSPSPTTRGAGCWGREVSFWCHPTRPHLARAARKVGARKYPGNAPPPPPPNVPALKDNTPGGKQLSVRERMEEHRKNPACAVCHKMMDPVGFALENFDAVGQWRDTEAGKPIDASGVLLDGTKVDGPVALREAILKRPQTFAGTMTEKLLTYALGRGLEYYDMPVVRSIVRRWRRTIIIFRRWCWVS